MMCIFQCLLNKEDFNGRSFICQIISTVIGYAGTVKTNTFIHIICAAYASTQEKPAHAVSFDIKRRTRVNRNSCVNQNRMFTGASWLCTPNTLLLQSTNHTVIGSSISSEKTYQCGIKENRQFVLVHP